MKKPSEFKTYFNNIADQLGMSFVYGATERILNRQSANLDYPVLWLEKPTISRSQNGNYRVRFRAAFVVLIACAPDDYDAIDTAQDSSHALTEKVLFRLEADAAVAPPVFEFDKENTRSDVIEGYSGDADTGWRTEFFIDTAGGCEDDFYDSEAWGAGDPDMMGAGAPFVFGSE